MSEPEVAMARIVGLGVGGQAPRRAFTKTFTWKKARREPAVKSAIYGQLRHGVNLGVNFI